MFSLPMVSINTNTNNTNQGILTMIVLAYMIRMISLVDSPSQWCDNPVVRPDYPQSVTTVITTVLLISE